MKAETITNTTMKFTFTEEERKAIALTGIALLTVQGVMETINADSMFETDIYSGLTLSEIDKITDLLTSLVDEKVWKVMTENEKRS